MQILLAFIMKTFNFQSFTITLFFAEWCSSSRYWTGFSSLTHIPIAGTTMDISEFTMKTIAN